MSVEYDRIAGRDLDRLGGLSDGVFAIAMTLLILDIRVPDPGPISTDAQLWNALVGLAPRFIAYLMSFLTLGIFWNGQQTQLRFFRRSDRNYVWIQLTFLAVVVAMPFSTSLLAEFITFRLAVVEYWLNILLLGTAILWGWEYGRRAGLQSDEATAAVTAAIRRRVIVAQSLYLFGALLAAANTAWSIAFILAVQLYYATGVRVPLLARTVIGRS